ncbi:MAG: hypothetical protein V1796_02735 [Pseudomonadota bacterium]
MSPFALVVVAAAFATVVALVPGISFMAGNREARHFGGGRRIEVSNDMAQNARRLFPLR